MSIVPGQDAEPREDPLPADPPLPPGVEDYSDDVDAIEKRIRARGPAEVRQADEQADAVEAAAGQEGRGTRADAANDPTSDEGADPEDPEAQHGEEPTTSSTD